jgi:hypothetical protein
MARHIDLRRFWQIGHTLLFWALVIVLTAILIMGCPLASAQERQIELTPTDRHVPELARYMERLQLSEPVVCRGLAVYSLQLIGGETLRGSWLTLDRAVSQGVLRITEKGSGGSVPVVVMENTSRDAHVFIMAGEVISGGKQTRAVRQDVVASPGERIELSVFCVEKHRWRGGGSFGSANQLVPQSIRKEIRRGADQAGVWSEVARNNRALGAENATGSLELALKSRDVSEKLAEVRRKIVPQVPRGTVGYIFVSHGRAVGAEMFGSEPMARELLPKLLDSYSVDFVLLGGRAVWRDEGRHTAAIDFYQRMRRVGSQRATTPGSGSGIRTRADRLLGDGVSLSGVVVHYGIQIRERVLPPPKPRPIIPVPEPYRN